MSTCRSAPPAAATATSTPIRPRSWAARTPTAGCERGAPGARAGPRRSVGPRRPSTRCSSAAGRRRCSARPGSRRCSTRSGRRSRSLPSAEVTTEATRSPTSPRVVRRLRDGRLHPGLARDAVGGPARPRVLDRRHSPGRALDGGAGGPGGGLRARQPRPDLRHAGGDRRRPAALGGRRRRGRASTTCPPTR